MNDDEPYRPMIPLLALFDWSEEKEAKGAAILPKRKYTPRKKKEAKTETPSNGLPGVPKS